MVLTLRTDPLGINCGFKKATFFESSLLHRKKTLSGTQKSQSVLLIKMKILSAEILDFSVTQILREINFGNSK